MPHANTFKAPAKQMDAIGSKLSSRFRQELKPKTPFGLSASAAAWRGDGLAPNGTWAGAAGHYECVW